MGTTYGTRAVLANVSRINSLAASPGLRGEMGSYNRARVEQEFTLARMAGDYLALFQETLG